MRKYCVAALWLCVFAAFSLGCDKADSPGSASKPKNNVTVVFIPKVTGNAFFESANAGLQEYAQKTGFTVEYRGSAEAAVARQRDIVKEAVSRKAEAICISSLDATALDEPLKEALRAGIKVVTWDSDVSTDARQIMVSQGTPEQLGRMLVEMGAKSLSSRGINPSRDEVAYVWHYSQATVTDQNSWRVAGEEYIRKFYPKWRNVAPENYYSEQDPDRAVSVGRTILAEHPKIDLIICNDSTSLPGQAEAAKTLGLTAKDVTITGFASPNPMRAYCKSGIVERWGLWDCRVQGSLGGYFAYLLATGRNLSVGDRVDVPDIGTVEVMPNSVLDPKAPNLADSGIVLLPQRLEFTAANVDEYDF